jgi:E3 ubiquitin-protein ligase NEDD4
MTQYLYWHIRYHFKDEPAIDAGGVAREFFEVVSATLFNPDCALFMYSGVDQLSMQINPNSGTANDEHLAFFHFAGRLMAKALLDKQIILAHLIRPLFKHMLIYPVEFEDLEYIDSEMYNGMMKFLNMEDVSCLCLDFTTSEETFGEVTTIELKPDGANCDVDNENLGEYMQCVLGYRTLDRVSEQLKHMLQGFYEVMPVEYLSVFDYSELELLLCGLPTIDMTDWQSNTEYSGEYASKGRDHKVIRWFWDAVNEFSPADRAKLLQFCTGTSRVPVQGFGALQGSDGNLQRFTITSVSRSSCALPRSHTCFNRIDLPLYPNEAELNKFLIMASFLALPSPPPPPPPPFLLSILPLMFLSSLPSFLLPQLPSLLPSFLPPSFSFLPFFLPSFL